MKFYKASISELTKKLIYHPLCLYSIIAVICTYPLAFKFNQLFGPASDNQLFIWNFWWFKHAIFDLHTNPFYTNYLFWPDGISLFFRISPPLNGMLALLLAPVFGMFGAYNVLIFLTYILSAFNAFLLGKYFGLSKIAAFIVGIYFAFNPYQYGYSQYHLNVVSVQFIPLFVLYLFKYRESYKFKYIIIASVIMAIIFYYDYFPFIYCCVILLLFAFYVRADKSVQSLAKYILMLAAVLGICIVLISPFMIPSLREIIGQNYISLGGADRYVVDLCGFFIPQEGHWLRRILPNINLINIEYPFGPWFLGYFSVLLVLYAIFKAKFKNKGFFIVISLTGILLALGSYPHVFKKPMPFIPLPYHLIEHIPIINAARTPARFAFLIYFGLSILVGFGSQALIDKGKQNGRLFMRKVVPLGIIIVLIADFFMAPFPMSTFAAPTFYNEIRDDPTDYGIMNLPLGSGERRFMALQITHQKPICGGFLARFSPKYWADMMKINYLSPDYLISKKIKYVILHREYTTQANYDTFMKTLNKQYQIVTEECGQVLFKVY